MRLRAGMKPRDLPALLATHGGEIVAGELVDELQAPPRRSEQCHRAVIEPVPSVRRVRSSLSPVLISVKGIGSADGRKTKCSF